MKKVNSGYIQLLGAMHQYPVVYLISIIILKIKLELHE